MAEDNWEDRLDTALDRGIRAAERTINNNYDILETTEEIFDEIENE